MNHAREFRGKVSSLARRAARSPLAVACGLALVFGYTAWRSNAAAGARRAASERPIMSNTIYKKPSEEQLRKSLTPIQYEVTQHAATEPPFRNQFWNNH